MENNYIYIPDKSQDEFRCRVPLKDTEQVFVVDGKGEKMGLDLAKGEITYGELLELFPFDNELVLCAIRGEDLKERFLETDNLDYFICCDENLTANIRDEEIYYVVVDSYSSIYPKNKLIEVERFGQSHFARDMLADYIRNGGLG